MLRLTGDKYEENIEIEGIPTVFPIFVANKFIDPLNIIDDGILGLGNDSNSVVYSLYTQNLIDKPIYSIQSITLEYSSLILGSFNFSDLGLESFLNTIISYTSLEGSFVYNDTCYDSFPLVFDSLSSYITGPIEQIQNFYDSLILDYGCYYYEEWVVCDCEGEYPDIEIIIQEKSFFVNFESYSMPVFGYLD